ALAQEAEPPCVEPRIGSKAQADRRLSAPQRLPQHARRTWRCPGEGVARRDDTRVARRGLESDTLLFLHHRDLVARFGQEVSRGHTDDAATQYQSLHAKHPCVRCSATSAGLARATDS